MFLIHNGRLSRSQSPAGLDLVHPWGVEPQSMEPESIILSIELWVRVADAKLMLFLQICKFNFKYGFLCDDAPVDSKTGGVCFFQILLCSNRSGLPPGA